MQLDVPTLMVMGSFVSACAGAVLFIAWSQHRKMPALLLWALGDIIAAIGILSLMLGSVLHQPAWFVFGGPLLALPPGLIWMAARTFDGKPTPMLLVPLGVMVAVIAYGIPGLRNVAYSLSILVAIAYYVAAATSLWLGRSERLASRQPIVTLIGLHAFVLLLGAVSTARSTVGQDMTPAVFSLFGMIHFEAIVFAVGTAIFILALVKERTEAALKVAARLDGLTGIANRAAFMESAARVIERCRREKAPVAVMMFDLDRFKVVNDTYGHATGDAVIRKFCEVVGAMVRPNDMFGRVGGEEFAVVLPGSGIEAACLRADRIRISFAENCHLAADHQVDATVSGGVSASDDAAHSLGALLEYADIALYRAKADGRNRIQRADRPQPKSGSASVLRVA